MAVGTAEEAEVVVDPPLPFFWKQLTVLTEFIRDIGSARLGRSAFAFSLCFVRATSLGIVHVGLWLLRFGFFFGLATSLSSLFGLPFPITHVDALSEVS